MSIDQFTEDSYEQALIDKDYRMMLMRSYKK
jgi:hypothetical protein